MARDPYEGMNKEFADRLRQMIKASGGRITIVSGHRTIERQQQLWEAAIKKYGSPAAARKWVAPPGKSNHNHGTAVDLGGDLKLAHRLAAQFGLHAPMRHEPWHIEPVHVRHEAPDEAYTPDPQTGLPPQPDRHDLKYQLASFMDVINRGVTDPGMSSPTLDEDQELVVGEVV